MNLHTKRTQPTPTHTHCVPVSPNHNMWLRPTTLHPFVSVSCWVVSCVTLLLRTNVVRPFSVVVYTRITIVTYSSVKHSVFGSHTPARTVLRGLYRQLCVSTVSRYKHGPPALRWRVRSVQGRWVWTWVTQNLNPVTILSPVEHRVDVQKIRSQFQSKQFHFVRVNI